MIAGALVWLAWWLLAGVLYGNARARDVSGWTAVFRPATDAGLVPVAVIHLLRGGQLRGVVADYSNDLEWAQRELVLSSPLVSIGADGTVQHLAVTHAVVPSTAIDHLDVVYATPQDIDQGEAMGDKLPDPPSRSDLPPPRPIIRRGLRHAAISHASQGSRVLRVCVAPPTPA